MGRKVLISFLGTGRINKEKKSEREYFTTKYKINDFEKEATFVAKVLKEYLNIETLILIGTMKSLWEEVYRQFCNKEDSYFWELAEKIDSINYESELDYEIFKKLELCLGYESKIIPIYYGVNQEQFKKSTQIIFDTLKTYLKDNDEIYLDVTHAFRSLPIILSQVLFYFQDISSKSITIKKVFYGMLEMNRELNYAPIVDISYLVELNKWIKASYSFINFGNAYLLADLIKQTNMSEAGLLKNFSDAFNLNLIFELQNNIQKLKGILNKEYPILGQLIIPENLKEFTKIPKSPQSKFQFYLAKWHFERKHYAQSIATLYESCVTFVCEKEGKDWQKINNRNNAKSKLNDYFDSIMTKLKLRDLRNAVCHNINLGDLKINTEIAISNISKAFNELDKYFK